MSKHVGAKFNITQDTTGYIIGTNNVLGSPPFVQMGCFVCGTSVGFYEKPFSSTKPDHIFCSMEHRKQESMRKKLEK